VYHPTTKVLALEIKRHTAVARILQYLYAHNTLADYRIEPLVTPTAWKDFEKARPKKFRLKIADPQNLEPIEGDAAMPVVDSLKRLANATEAPYITIEASMGNRKGDLSGDMVRRLLSLFGGSDRDADVRSLSVSVRDESTKATQLIDFLDQVLSVEGTMVLQDDNPEANYTTRSTWIKLQFAAQLTYITSVYGDESGG
jgi:hypothetical protein